MGFKKTRQILIQALQEGRFEHEAREAIEDKNLLATGDVTVDFVVTLLQSCDGRRHQARPHHWDDRQIVDVFRPKFNGVTWYIKTYFVERAGIMAVVISVHPSD